MRCCDRVIPPSEAADIAKGALAREYAFLNKAVEIEVAQVMYENCVWNVRLHVTIDDSPVLLMSTHFVQVDACTGRVTGYAMEDHAVATIGRRL